MLVFLLHRMTRRLRDFAILRYYIYTNHMHFIIPLQIDCIYIIAQKKTVTFNVTFLNYGLVKTGGNNVLNKILEIS